jgi:transposase
VERTFAWLGHYRRLSRDNEHLTSTSEAVIQIRHDSAAAAPSNQVMTLSDPSMRRL